MKLEIIPCVVVSTIHVTKNDGRLMLSSEQSKNRLALHEGGYGAFFHIHQDCFKEQLEDLKKAGYSEGFIALFKTLKKKGCGMIQFDCDGPIYSAFPKFKW